MKKVPSRLISMSGLAVVLLLSATPVIAQSSSSQSSANSQSQSSANSQNQSSASSKGKSKSACRTQWSWRQFRHVTVCR